MTRDSNLTRKLRLARLSHPHIAQLYEAGTTDEGYPYFAMEYFPGEAITDFCDRERLSIAQRLGLFTTVCEAVHHAHQRGIIHRDLKPSNILVASVDGKYMAKVIDFGIAKAIDQPLTDALELTGEIVIGTPSYMSPESLRLTEGVIDVDTRSDVYSLGVLLYELLTGLRPFVSQGTNMARMMMDRIASGEAQRPSTRLSSETDETQAQVADQRHTEVAKLQRYLAGDLDWIVGMAIAKDREERYSSAAEFGKDVQRHLDHQPVIASPPSVRYRVVKFVRRYRALVAVGVIALCALVAGTIGTTIGMVRASREAERANHEAAAAHEVTEFLVSMFEVSNPNTSLGNTITARELLDSGAEKIHGGLREQPLLSARFMQTIGTIYKNLGIYDEAELLLAEALRIRESQSETRPLYLADTHNTLGEIYQVRGMYDEAITEHKRALEIQERVAGPDDYNVSKSLTGIGRIYNQQGRYEEAEPLLLRSLNIRENTIRADEPRLADSFGQLHVAQGRLHEAKVLFERAMSIQEKKLPADHPKAIATRVAYDDLLKVMGQ